ncbi:DASS family sodium-coupled anion symporter [Helicobacter cetorum]|uniref:DASS family sodium-coupled anion symporter n=1 Tax=Helicobacter cetorum TaxID=138563 RepID=UPI000CF0EA45|nr:DASS family sodium-coupled anion symporter [Helicobacter cetorum]
MKQTLLALAPIISALCLYFIGVPNGLNPNAWLYFCIFIGMIIGLVLEPVPSGLVVLSALVVCVLFKIGVSPKIASPNEAITWALSGYSNKTVWLIVVAFMLGLGYEKSLLGKRIALFLISFLGKTTLGLGYAVAIADLCLAPFIPSNSARSGGILYPIISSIPPLMGSTPSNNPNKIGAYLMWVALASTCITSSMFLSALAPNLLAMESVVKMGINEISWLSWFLAFLPSGVILILLVPLLAYKTCTPTLKGSKEVSLWAKEELKIMGAFSLKEILMLGLTLLALLGWIFSKTLGLHASTTALIVMVLMVFFKIISYNDILKNKEAFNILILFGALITMASGLKNVGFLTFVGNSAKDFLEHTSLEPLIITLIIVILFYMLHYLFASITAHVSALLALFIGVASNIQGINIQELALFLMLTLGIMGILTPYGTGPSTIYYGSGYIKSKDFWKLGLIFGMIYLIVFLSVCVPWVKYVAFRWL